MKYIFITRILFHRLDGGKSVGTCPWPIEVLLPASRNVPKLREIAASKNTHLMFELQGLLANDEGLNIFCSVPNFSLTVFSILITAC